MVTQGVDRVLASFPGSCLGCWVLISYCIPDSFSQIITYLWISFFINITHYIYLLHEVKTTRRDGMTYSKTLRHFSNSWPEFSLAFEILPQPQHQCSLLLDHHLYFQKSCLLPLRYFYYVSFHHPQHVLIN